MNIKALLIIAGYVVCTDPTTAQTVTGSEEDAHSRDMRVEFGVRTGGFLSIERSDGFRQLNNLHGVLGGASVRVRSGAHHRFGLELAAHHGITEQSFTPEYTLTGPAPTGTGFRKRTADILIQAQVHPGRDSQAVRPFVGGGLGVGWEAYTSKSNTLEDQLNGYSFGGPSSIEPLLQIEQGFTWQVSEHFYLSQSLYYRYAMDFGTSNVGIRVGGFYGL